MLHRKLERVELLQWRARVTFDNDSITDVSGKDGGGVVLAGGNWQGGKNPNMPKKLPSFGIGGGS